MTMMTIRTTAIRSERARHWFPEGRRRMDNRGVRRLSIRSSRITDGWAEAEAVDFVLEQVEAMGRYHEPLRSRPVGVPVPHHQSQNLVGFVEAGELAGVRHFAAEDLPVIFTPCLSYRWRRASTVARVGQFSGVACQRNA